MMKAGTSNAASKDTLIRVVTTIACSGGACSASGRMYLR